MNDGSALTSFPEMKVFTAELPRILKYGDLELFPDEEPCSHGEKIIPWHQICDLSESVIQDIFEKIVEHNINSESLICTNKWGVPEEDDWPYLDLYQTSIGHYLKKMTVAGSNFERFFLINDQHAAQFERHCAVEIDVLFENRHRNNATRANEDTIVSREKPGFDFIHVDYETNIYATNEFFIFEEGLGAIGPLGGFVDKITKIVVPAKNLKKELVEQLISKNFDTSEFQNNAQHHLDELGIDCELFQNSVQEALQQQEIVFKKFERRAS